MESKQKIWVVEAIPKLIEDVTCKNRSHSSCIVGVCRTEPTKADMKSMLEGWYFELQRNAGDSKEEARESCEDVHEDWEATAEETWFYV